MKKDQENNNSEHFIYKIAYMTEEEERKDTIRQIKIIFKLFFLVPFIGFVILALIAGLIS